MQPIRFGDEGHAEVFVGRRGAGGADAVDGLDVFDRDGAGNLVGEDGFASLFLDEVEGELGDVDGGDVGAVDEAHEVEVQG